MLVVWVWVWKSICAFLDYVLQCEDFHSSACVVLYCACVWEFHLPLFGWHNWVIGLYSFSERRVGAPPSLYVCVPCAERAEVVRRKRTKILMEKKQYMSDKRNAMSFHNKHNRRRREKMLHGVYAQVATVLFPPLCSSFSTVLSTDVHPLHMGVQISPRTKPTKAAKEGTVESSAAACPLTSVQENCAPSTSVPSLDSDSYRQLVDGGYSDLEEVLSDGETDNLDTESAAWSPSSSSDGDAVVPIHNMVAKVPPSPPQSPDESSLEASH